MLPGHVTLADSPNAGIGPATDFGCSEVNGLSAFGCEEGDLIFWAP
jgi:hypothetical protein